MYSRGGALVYGARARELGRGRRATLELGRALLALGRELGRALLDAIVVEAAVEGFGRLGGGALSSAPRARRTSPSYIYI